MHLLMSNFSVRHRLQRFPLQKFGDTWAMTDQEILNSDQEILIYIYIYIYIYEASTHRKFGLNGLNVYGGRKHG